MKESIIAELEAWAESCGLENEPEIEDINKAYKDFKDILSRARSQEAGLVEELTRWADQTVGDVDDYAVERLVEIISKYPPDCQNTRPLR